MVWLGFVTVQVPPDRVGIKGVLVESDSSSIRYFKKEKDECLKVFRLRLEPARMKAGQFRHPRI